MAAFAEGHGSLLGETDPRELHWLISKTWQDQGSQGTWPPALFHSLWDRGQVTQLLYAVDFLKFSRDDNLL